MTSSTDTVITSIEAFEPLDESSNVHRLHQLLSAVSPSDGLRVTVTMLLLLERFPDAELGSPGPVVHWLEAVLGYQPLLKESLERRPTSYTVWMVNRILISKLETDARESWLRVLTGVLVHPLASEHVKELAHHFIELSLGTTMPNQAFKPTGHKKPWPAA